MKVENLLKIMGVLGKGVFEGYNINQISRLSGVDVATTHRILKEMEKRNEVLKTKRGNNNFYRPNLDNASTVKYCELYSIERRKEFFLKQPRLHGIVSQLSKEAESIILFGSMARGEKNPRDIDFLLLSGKKHNVKIIEKIIKDSNISPLYMQFGEFSEKLKERNETLKEIVRDGIVLHGEEKYWKAVKGVV